jgi:hypothetical protein
VSEKFIIVVQALMICIGIGISSGIGAAFLPSLLGVGLSWPQKEVAFIGFTIFGVITGIISAIRFWR